MLFTTLIALVAAGTLAGVTWWMNREEPDDAQKLVFGSVQLMCVLVLLFAGYLFYMKPAFLFGPKIDIVVDGF